MSCYIAFHNVITIFKFIYVMNLKLDQVELKSITEKGIINERI